MFFETLITLLNSNFPSYLIILFLTTVSLIVASIFDIKTREVPDLLNYGLIFAGIGLRFIYSAVTFDWSFLLAGLAGLGVFFALALILFYAGQWGGGDSKLLMGMGALFGIKFNLNSFFENSVDNFIINFIINMFIAGAIYGFIWSSGLLIIHRKKFSAAFLEKIHDKNIKIMKIVMFGIVFLLLIGAILARDSVYNIILFAFAIIVYLTFYLWLFVKTIETVCMIKKIPPNKLTEGDWIANEVYVHGKYICGPKDLGIEKDQIVRLKKLKVRFVLVKEGIPFIPSFLFGFIITLVFGNWWMRFIL